MRFLLYLLFATPLSLFACDCIYSENFCEYTHDMMDWSPDSVVVMRARFREFRAPVEDRRRLPFFDFKVVEVLVGEIEAPIVSLFGDGGVSCLGPNLELTEGDEYILLFSNRRGYFSYLARIGYSHAYPVYGYPGCGEATLEVSNNWVSGKITEGVSSISLNSLRDQLTECLGEEFINPPGAGFLPYYEASVRPNPASESFTVVFDEPTPVFAVSLYDMRGRLISEERRDGSEIRESHINVSQLPAGVYQLVVLTDGIRVREQVVVF